MVWVQYSFELTLIQSAAWPVTTSSESEMSYSRVQTWVWHRDYLCCRLRGRSFCPHAVSVTLINRTKCPPWSGCVESPYLLKVPILYTASSLSCLCCVNWSPATLLLAEARNLLSHCNTGACLWFDVRPCDQVISSGTITCTHALIVGLLMSPPTPHNSHTHTNTHTTT